VFNPKIIFWILVALVIATLNPETIVKAMAVYWTVLVIGWVGWRLFYRYCEKRGKVTVRWTRK
jgi:hypothetical protein